MTANLFYLYISLDDLDILREGIKELRRKNEGEGDKECGRHCEDPRRLVAETKQSGSKIASTLLWMPSRNDG